MCSSPLTTFVKESNKKFDVLEPTRTQRFIPTCHHCGVKGHIQPRCNALRNVSRATNVNGFKIHVSSLKNVSLQNLFFVQGINILHLQNLVSLNQKGSFLLAIIVAH